VYLPPLGELLRVSETGYACLVSKNDHAALKAVVTRERRVHPCEAITITVAEFPTERVEAATDAVVVSISRLSGGEIGSAWRASLDTGRVVAAKTGPAPLDVEARSLDRLADAGVPTPDVLYADADVLVLDYVAGAEWTPSAEHELGRLLARVHQHTNDTYGWPEPTWKGRFRQPNEFLGDWPTFYADRRLRPVADAASDADGITDDLRDRVYALADDLHDLLPTNPTPSLLHGDLWKNNAIPDRDTVLALIDPAPWYGHREVEVAYAEWCGVNESFRNGYAEIRELEREFEDRRPLYETHFALDHAFHFPDEEYDEWAEDRLDRLGY